MDEPAEELKHPETAGDTPGHLRQRPGLSDEKRVQAAVEHAVTLTGTAARTEQDIAQALQALAARDGSESAARRVALAEDALKAAQATEEGRARLEDLTRRWAEHADVTRLHVLLLHARTVLTDLAGTEQGIADTLMSLALQGRPEFAAHRRRAAAEAARWAERARERARALRELADSTAQPPSAEPSGHDAGPQLPDEG